jgi:hypothetical protein
VSVDQDAVIARRYNLDARECKKQRLAGKAYCVTHHKFHPRSMFKVDPNNVGKPMNRCRHARRQLANPYGTKQPKQAEKFKPWGGRQLSLSEDDVYNLVKEGKA